MEPKEFKEICNSIDGELMEIHTVHNIESMVFLYQVNADKLTGKFHSQGYIEEENVLNCMIALKEQSPEVFSMFRAAIIAAEIPEGKLDEVLRQMKLKREN